MGLFSKLFGSDQPQSSRIIITTTSDGDQPLQDKHVFSDNDPTLLESIQATEIAQPIQKLPFSAVCPYCGAVQPKPIGRKKICPDCKGVIFVRTAQDLYPISALTKEQVANVDFYISLKNTLMATRGDYVQHERILQKRWNTSNINTYDVLWSMYNDAHLLQRNIDKTTDKKWALIQMFRNHQYTTIDAAQYQAARGHNPIPYLKTAHDYSLKTAKLDESVEGLTVQSYACCDACTKFHDKTFSLDFVEKNPVLPIKTCTRPFEDGSKFVFCICRYQEYYES